MLIPLLNILYFIIIHIIQYNILYKALLKYKYKWLKLLFFLRKKDNHHPYTGDERVKLAKKFEEWRE